MTVSTDWVEQGYDFTCSRCGGSWTSRYEVRRYVDAAGAAWEHYRLHGLPATVPMGVACPHCGGLRVRLAAIHPALALVGAGAGAPGQPTGVAAEDLAAPQDESAGAAQPATRRPVQALTRVIYGTEERVELLMDGHVKLVLRHGHGTESVQLRYAMARPVGTRIGAVPALFDPAALAGSIARLLWQRGDEWFLLAGSTDESTLVAAAEQVEGLLEFLPVRLPRRP